MSLRIAPASSHATSTTNTTSKSTLNASTSTLPRGAPSAPGLHDTLRTSLQNPTSPSSPNSANPTLASTHPLESRLMQWHATQVNLKHQLLARTYGIAEPLRREMELKMVREGDFRPSVLGPQGSVHEDILSGRDAEITWEDVYQGQDGLVGGVSGSGGDGQGVSVLEEMERRVGMGKW